MPKSQQSWVSIPDSADTVESGGRHMKQCWITHLKRKNPEKSPFKKQSNISFWTSIFCSDFCCVWAERTRLRSTLTAFSRLSPGYLPRWRRSRMEEKKPKSRSRRLCPQRQSWPNRWRTTWSSRASSGSTVWAARIARAAKEPRRQSIIRCRVFF